jgi:triosephosphate isomerase
MGRPLVYAANWKMHHGAAAARDFARRFSELTQPQEGRELWFFPTAVALSPLVDAFRRRTDIRIGAQNVHWEPKGAFTGELSVSLVAEAGATHVLIGHSERRHLFGETDDQSARKAAAVLAAGLVALVCVGETLEDREAGRTDETVRRPGWSSPTSRSGPSALAGTPLRPTRPRCTDAFGSALRPAAGRTACGCSTGEA